MLTCDHLNEPQCDAACLGNRRRGPGQKEELRGPGGEQGVLRRVIEDCHGDLPEVPGQGARAAAISGGRALEPAVLCPGAGRLGGGSLEQRRREPGVVVVQGHQVISAELEQMIWVLLQQSSYESGSSWF